MIARILIPLLLLTLLPDVYTAWRRRRRWRQEWPRRLAGLLPSLAIVALTLYIAADRRFVPSDTRLLHACLLLTGVWVVPRFVYTLARAAGNAYCRLFRRRRHPFKLVGIIAALGCVWVVVYGATAGFRRITVDHVDITLPSLPESMEGTRVVHISDIHAGTFEGDRREVLRRAVDSVNAQRADIICFTGDIQNIQPSELYPVATLLGSMRARHGVYSVLGNHDYSMYMDADPAVRVASERETIARERQMGWHVLLNSHAAIGCGKDSLYIAGTENDGEPPFPSTADAAASVRGIPGGSAVIMLQHDPSAWRRHILPLTGAGLTLSGHTHGGQLSLFGLRPTMWKYGEDKGLYSEGDRSLYVSTGLGGLLPFRYGVYAEITVITLHCKR